MKHVFIIGSKGIPSNYGGFETFVDELVSRQTNPDIKYHVSCLSDNNDEFVYNGARCFNVKVKEIGNAKAILYDIASLNRCIAYIKSKKLNNTIIYILASRIGPFLKYKKKELVDNNIKVILNPDGHEWKRSKWSKVVRSYWKLSEKYMVKYSDLVICDSENIEEYIKTEYKSYNPNTCFIPYGAEVPSKEQLSKNTDLNNWYSRFQVKANNYYLIVGRFVPENNYEIMIREFMQSNTSMDLVIITNVEKNKFYMDLKEKTNFEKDSRIKFVGTVYDSDLLNRIRSNAFAYIHGHSVGGTNPSLLEALATTSVNLLYNVSFNQEVGKDSSLYFTEEVGDLKRIIEKTEKLDENDIKVYKIKATNRIEEAYSWRKIVADYESIFTSRN